MSMSRIKPTKSSGTGSPHTVSSSVLERIERDQIQPRSRLFFHSRECVIWALWFVSVLVGAVAVAVTLYVSMSLPYTLYEATHDNFLTAAISFLPYLWLMIFMVMAYLAIINLRYTRRGYRYRTVELLGSSVVISLLLGVGMQLLGQGYVLDRTLGSWVAAYPSYEKKRLSVWQNPAEGRLVGTLLPLADSDEADQTDKQFVFHDIDEQVWDIDVRELGEQDLAVLHDSGVQQVRVIGTSTAPNVFHLCGVFSWLSSEQMTRDELQRVREAFMHTMQLHVAEQLADPVADDPFADSADRAGERPCRDIAAVRRAESLLAQ